MPNPDNNNPAARFLHRSEAMPNMDKPEKQAELQQLKDRVEKLESEIEQSRPVTHWQPSGYYTAYYATSGFLLGIFGAMASLLVNVVGAPLAGKSPLELICVYLTFPLGEKALGLADSAQNVYAVSNGLILTIGCCLYLATGMLLGVPFYVALTRLTQNSSVAMRYVVAAVLSLLVWLVNFYGILSWLQPALFGGNWIVEQVPPWVAAVTHLVFGMTIALLYPLGQFVPYQRPTEKS